jgi:hypothetical protein
MHTVLHVRLLDPQLSDLSTDVHEHVLFGTLYHRDDDRVSPGVRPLGDAEGGMHEDDAALPAAHRYTVLAMAHSGTPATPHDIPLEYCDRTLGYLDAHAHVDRQRPAVVGASTGGEVDS